jgi:tyrosinase
MAIGAPSAQTLAANVRFRRNAANLTAGQLRALRSAFVAVYAIHDDRGYERWAGIHGLPLPIGCDNAHGTPYFLPWHRAYLYFFERALRDQVADAMLTWWDWRRPTLAPAIPPAFADRQAGQSANSLYQARVSALALKQGRDQGMSISATTRRAPASPTQLPTASDVEGALSRRSFLDFTQAVEELHNQIHVWVGGHMAQIPYAAFDPIFWAHHAMVDRLWRIWQLRHPGAGPPASLLDEALPPFRMTVRQTLDVTALGYDYAVTTTSAGAG